MRAKISQLNIIRVYLCFLKQGIEILCLNKVAYKKRERAQKRKEMEILMKDNLLNILTVPGTPIR